MLEHGRPYFRFFSQGHTDYHQNEDRIFFRDDITSSAFLIEHSSPLVKILNQTYCELYV